MKYTKDRIICWLMTILIVLSCSGCGRKEALQIENGLVFGFSVYDNSATYFKRMTDAVSLRCAEMGIELLVKDSAGNGNTMISDCDNMIGQGVDALLVSPCQPDALTGIVEKAHQKNIPVIVIDIGDGGSDKDAMIISDCFGGGEAAAEYAMQLLQSAGNTSKETAIIKCEESAVYANQRGAGYRSGMETGKYQTVAEVRADSSEEKAYEAMKEILEQHTGISNVFAENDAMALGAQRAVLEKGRDDIVVIGFNGDTEAMNSIRAGQMKGTVAQEPFQMGYMAVELAVDCVEGTAIAFDEEENRIIYADVYMVGSDGKKAGQ